MRRAAPVCLLLVLATTAAYWPVSRAGFLNFDDNQYVTNNPMVFQGLTGASVKWAFTTFHASNWHPLTWLSHMLDCQIFGDRPAAHHWVNVGFHCVNACLLFFVLWRTTSAFGRSAFVAALFALHPLHVESVAWIAERKDVLSGFFFLLTLLAYARYVGSVRCQVSGDQKSETRNSKAEANSKAEVRGDPVRSSEFEVQSSKFARRIWYLLSFVLFILGLMSKPMLVTLPFLLLLLDFWPLGRVQGPKSNSDKSRAGVQSLILEKVPFFALSLASCIITFYAQKAGGAVVTVKDVPLEARLENAAIGYIFYLAKAFWPARLAVFYPYPDHFRLAGGIAAAIALLVFTIAAFRFVRRVPYLFVGWFWFMGMLVPVIGLVQVGSQMAADRYTYLPLIGIFIMIVWGACDLLSMSLGCWTSRSPSPPPSPQGEGERLAVPVSTGRSRSQYRVYWVLASAGAVVLIVFSVVTFRQVRYWRDSVTLFTHALEISPENNPIVEHNLGHALSLSGDQPAAIAHFKQAIRYRADFPAAHLNWGNSLGVEGKVDEAIEHYQDAIRYQPSYEEAHYQLGNAYALQGKLDQAEATFREAIHWKPDYAEAYVKLANVLDLKGNVEQARSNWWAALKYRPDYDEPHFYLAGSFARQKKFADAIFQFRAALKINLRYPSALNDLAWILATQSDPQLRDVPDAVRLSEKACQLTNRTNAMYLDTFAVALSESGRFPEAAGAASNAVSVAESSGQSAVVPELQKHLDLFKAGKAYEDASRVR